MANPSTMTLLQIYARCTDETSPLTDMAHWNLDGSWTVDWPMVERQAARSVHLEYPATTEPPIDATEFAAIDHSGDFVVLMARALLAAKAKDKLWENPNPDNTYPPAQRGDGGIPTHDASP